MDKSITQTQIISGVVTAGVASFFSILPTSALTYQDTVDVSFTLEPSVSITLSSSDLVINNLVPGQNSDSNVITLTAASNSPAGYTISSTVGNSTDFTNTNLKHSTDASAEPAKFTSLGTSDSVSTLANLTAGYWGYSFSLDGGTNWINATKTGNVNNTGYSGLPLYTTDAPAELLSVATSATSTIDFKIAAASTTTQAAGEYNNVINFITVAAPMPSKTYIQDLTLSECQTQATSAPLTVYDRRDGSDYTVRYINGACWMTQNLRITGIISATDSNFTGNNFNVSAYDYETIGSNECDNYDNSCNHTSDSNIEYGAWYNYAAATAGTITGENNATIATEDICPSEWHLPNYDVSGPAGSINSLTGNTTYLELFSPIDGGLYRGNGVRYESFTGCWWSTTADVEDEEFSDYYRYRLEYYHSLLAHSDDRTDGCYVRCVQTSQ